MGGKLIRKKMVGVVTRKNIVVLMVGVRGTAKSSAAMTHRVTKVVSRVPPCGARATSVGTRTTALELAVRIVDKRRAARMRDKMIAARIVDKMNAARIADNRIVAHKTESAHQAGRKQLSVTAVVRVMLTELSAPKTRVVDKRIARRMMQKMLGVMTVVVIGVRTAVQTEHDPGNVGVTHLRRKRNGARLHVTDTVGRKLPGKQH